MNLPETAYESLPAAGPPEQLVVLVHGWRADARSMMPLAERLRAAFPQAALLAPLGPHPGDGSTPERPRGRQWYAVEGLDESNWPARIAAALPGLVAWVRAQQQRLGVGPAATALAGFSQGGILSLSAALQHDGIAGRVLAFGARLPALPEAAPRHTTLHLFHGDADEIFPVQHARACFEALAALQGDATIDIAAGVGHVLHPALIDCALHRLEGHIPARTWQRALGGLAGHEGASRGSGG